MITDAFEQLEDEEGTRQGFCHIRIQQRTGRKTITTVQVRKVAMKSSVCTILLLLSLRVIGVFLVRTWFVPDEIFQSVEVAHYAVFGVGHLSWEWRHSLRSVIHPSIIALVYWLLHFLGIDSNFAIVFTPRFIHAILFAMSDLCFFDLAKRILSTLEARFALFSYTSCWFVWYCAPRTLSNSLETALSLIALKWYPFKSLNRLCWPYMTIGAMTILIRPTAILLWIPLGLWHLVRSQSRCRLILTTSLPAVLPILVIAFMLDSWAYGKWTLSTWNFAKFNVFEGGSSHFGAHPWHWFLSQGLPSTLTVQLIPIIGGVIAALLWRKVTLSLLNICLFYVIFHSCLAHKEHRFMLPVIPLLCIYAGHFFGVAVRISTGIVHALIALLIVVNVPTALYLGLYHQVGPMSASEFIANNAKMIYGINEHFNVLQLMPCYSMPQYCHLHELNCTVRALDCSPNLGNVANFVDEADLFHSDPIAFVESNIDLVNDADYIVVYKKTFSMEYNCNGTTVEHPEYGEVIQLTGDQRQHIKDFLCKVGIVKEENCKIHGF
ncbi:unnamed protein product [Toxocara canis]|uniref:Mannosyltransferase n=1 Tax=Toxocara canis TaxID=6265 RepID=A0A3P7GZ29_TOXCA|nr:unnamed protein product [Toxocara canis]